MVKLFQINSVVNFGSTGHIVEDLGELVQKKGWASYVGYGRKKRQSSSITFFLNNSFSLLLHVFISKIFDLHGLGSIISTKIFIKKLEKVNPDIIHLHNIHGYFINYTLLFRFLSQQKKNVVWTLHDCWAYTGHCSHYSYVKCKKWCSLCINCPQKKEYPTSLLFDNSKYNFIKKRSCFSDLNNLIVVTPSKWLAEEVKKSFLKKYTVKVIYNGIDLNIFRPASKNPYNQYFIGNKKIILGVANVWGDRKGLYDFIKLNEIIDHKIYQIVLIGLNKKQIKKIPREIIGIERTESVKELVEYYSFASVLFSASVEETLGLTTVEAQACGTPCVVYNATAIPETVVDGKTGIVVEPNNVSKVYSAIQRITNVPKVNYSNECIQWVKTTFDKNINYQKYLEIYDCLLNCK